MYIYVPIHDAKTNLSDLISRAAYGRGRFIIEQDGRPMVAIIGLEELKQLETSAASRDLEALNIAIEESESTVPFQAVLQQYEELFGEELELKEQEDGI